MVLSILEGRVDGVVRVVLLDSYTDRPLNIPVFNDREEAESFLSFLGAAGPSDLLAKHARWLELPACGRCGQRVVHPGEVPDECEGCRPPCDWSEGTCDARGTEVIKMAGPSRLDRYCAFHAAQIRRQKAKAT